VGMELGMGIDTAMKVFSCITGRKDSRCRPGHQARFSSAEQFQNGNGLNQAAECERAFVSKVKGCRPSVRNSSQEPPSQEAVKKALSEAGTVMRVRRRSKGR
jgi:hypothetical protein